MENSEANIEIKERGMIYFTLSFISVLIVCCAPDICGAFIREFRRAYGK